MKYWKYLWLNSKWLAIWLAVVSFFIWYWVTYQEDYSSDVIKTIVIAGGITLLIVVIMYFKWRNL